MTKLALLRRQKGLTQRDVARLLGTAQTTISHWERHVKTTKIMPDAAQQLEELFERPIEELLTPLVA